jgi:hypothetical protein
MSRLTLARSASEGNPRPSKAPRLRFGLVSDFAALGKRISDWTTNVLATVIVLACGLALGWQVISWWHEDSAAAGADALAAAMNLPELGAGQEFWTKSGALKIERIRGDASAAVAAMQQFCRTVALSAASQPAAEAETMFVAKLADQSPLEESGDLALYQPQDQKSMVVAVRRSSRRIVGWSFALPARDGVWSVYHFQPAHAAGQTP